MPSTIDARVAAEAANTTQAGQSQPRRVVYGAPAPDPFGVTPPRPKQGVLERLRGVLGMALGRDDQSADYECARG